MKPYAPDTFDRLLVGLRPRALISRADIEELAQGALFVCLLWVAGWALLLRVVDGPYQMLPYFN